MMAQTGKEPDVLSAPVTRLSMWARSARLPRHTVRLRLTALYGGLFLLCGAGLLAVTNALVRYDKVAALPAGLLGATGAGKGTGIAVERISSSGLPASHGNGAAGVAQAAGAAAYAATLHLLLIQSGIALAIMAVASILLGWFVAGRVLKPLHTITTTVQQITATNLHQRLALDGPDDELKALGETFDELLARLETSFDAQRRFVANASHELRTPLTMMRTALDVATGKPAPPPPEVRALAVKLRRGLDMADRLLESFLTLARADYIPVAQDATAYLDQAAAAALAAHSQAISGMGLSVERDLRAAPVRGNEVLLARMVTNIIDNAVRHNEPSGWVRVATGTGKTSARLVVETGGRVLDKRQVSDLAQPFRRIGADRTGSDNGVGLGLSIVAAVAAAHHGTLELQARKGGGLRVAVTLPAAAQPAKAGVLAISGAPA
jgi:signal transduction histidine kinase